MDKIRVDGSNGLRFSLRRVKGCFNPAGGGQTLAATTVAATSSSSSGLGQPQLSQSASSSVSAPISSSSDSLLRLTKNEINPNKAVFTIDSKTSQILIVNNNACQLLGYSSKELCNMQFSNLLSNNKNKSHICALAEGQLNSEDGTIVLLSGKVVEMNTKTNDKVAVSLWIRQIDNDGRCLAVAEPVERKICQFIVDQNGIILYAEYECLMIFQFESIEHLIGMEIPALIPAIQLPDPLTTTPTSEIKKCIRKQKATGKTADGISFPLCLLINHINDELLSSNNCNNKIATIAAKSALSSASANNIKDDSYDDSTNIIGGNAECNVISIENKEMSSIREAASKNLQSSSSHQNLLYSITIWVFQNLSGLIVIDEFGSIQSCNHHFSMLMFGYAQNKIINNHITKLIPNFGQELQFLGLTRSRNVTETSLDNESEPEADPVYIVSGQQQQHQNHRRQLMQNNDGNCGISNEINNREISNSFSKYQCSKYLDSSTVLVTSSDGLSNFSKDKDLYLPTTKIPNDNTPPLSENLENDKNIPNVTPDIRQHSIMITDVSNIELQLNNDNDVLTPVNDNSMNQSYCFSTTASSMASSAYNNGNATTTTSLDISSSSSSSFTRFSMHHQQQLQQHQKSNCSGKSISSSQQKPLGIQQTSAAPVTCLTSTPDKGDARKNSQTSPSPSSTAAKSLHQYLDGRYKGEAVHNDGNVIDILYTISKQLLPCGKRIYCVWICRDPDTVYDDDDCVTGNGDYDDYDGRHQNLTLTFNSVTSTIEHSLGQAIKNTAAQNSSRPNSVSLMSQCEEEQISGEFSKHYTTLKQIGKGAYGYVKMAYRNTDRLLVVAKFILKDRLCPQFMIITDDKKEIPMEIFILTRVKHPNIVTVYDVFENERFFQLVMEKHGSGMDLFEFIDRRPLIDEKLGSYIFRQIANAVNYLHSLNILHRDIKDENIIIDHNFHIKLIDFGSATFMEEGKLFSTFFGTTEYCSPEVLAGNKYAGPELEMWSLGVTLYVLMFFENPFVDIEETLKLNLVMVHKVSTNLEYLLRRMLDKNPRTRYTMQQLMSDPWINQEINPSVFNFSWIVPCELYEANPDKYYTGQLYSSTTALSTTSPQDSLSLVDEDSMIDGEEVNNDDNDYDNEHDNINLLDEDKLNMQFQQARICDNSDKSLSVQCKELSQQCDSNISDVNSGGSKLVISKTTSDSQVPNIINDKQTKGKNNSSLHIRKSIPSSDTEQKSSNSKKTCHPANIINPTVTIANTLNSNIVTATYTNVTTANNSINTTISKNFAIATNITTTTTPSTATTNITTTTINDNSFTASINTFSTTNSPTSSSNIKYFGTCKNCLIQENKTICNQKSLLKKSQQQQKYFNNSLNIVDNSINSTSTKILNKTNFYCNNSSSFTSSLAATAVDSSSFSKFTNSSNINNSNNFYNYSTICDNNLTLNISTTITSTKTTTSTPITYTTVTTVGITETPVTDIVNSSFKNLKNCNNNNNKNQIHNNYKCKSANIYYTKTNSNKIINKNNSPLTTATNKLIPSLSLVTLMTTTTATIPSITSTTTKFKDNEQYDIKKNNYFNSEANNCSINKNNKPFIKNSTISNSLSSFKEEVKATSAASSSSSSSIKTIISNSTTINATQQLSSLLITKKSSSDYLQPTSSSTLSLKRKLSDTYKTISLDSYENFYGEDFYHCNVDIEDDDADNDEDNENIDNNIDDSIDNDENNENYAEDFDDDDDYDDIDIDDDDDDDTKNHQILLYKNKYENKPLLKVETIINNPLILSKSENNISDDKKSNKKFAIYDVVSLNDLNVNDPFPNNSNMNDLSKIIHQDEQQQQQTDEKEDDGEINIYNMHLNIK